MNIEQLITKIKADSSNNIFPPEGIPTVGGKYTLPTDLVQFYSLCGGVQLYEDKPYSTKIVAPNDFVSANPALIGAEIIEAEKAKGTYDNEISVDWFIIASLGNSDFIVMDLNPERHGRCYSAFWDSYPLVGDTPIIANSFTELFQRLIDNEGEYWYFLEKDFSMGDAYDNI